MLIDQICILSQAVVSIRDTTAVAHPWRCMRRLPLTTLSPADWSWPMRRRLWLSSRLTTPTPSPSTATRSEGTAFWVSFCSRIRIKIFCTGLSVRHACVLHECSVILTSVWKMYLKSLFVWICFLWKPVSATSEKIVTLYLRCPCYSVIIHLSNE